jgi:uncharacterized repeat protein (TIGR01451 family)
MSRPASAAADSLTVTKTAPATAAPGEQFNYVITLSYSGTNATGDVTVTDPLPAEIRFIAVDSISNGTCATLPQPGTNGTVSCAMRFGPTALNSTITLRVEAVQAGTATNTVQVTGFGDTTLTDTATTAIVEPPPPPAGSFTVTNTGPPTLLVPDQRGVRFSYTTTIDYGGAPRTAWIQTRFVDRLPFPATSPRFESSDGVAVSDCSADEGPPADDGAPGYVHIQCAISIDPTRPASLTMSVGVYPNRLGTYTNEFELANGDAGSWTTEFVRDEPPPPAPPPPPPPLPGPPAAPAKTVVETFTEAGDAEPEAVPVAPSAETVQVALTWSDPESSFDAVGFRLVQSGRKVAAAEKKKSPKLRIKKIRKKRSLEVRVRNVRRGTLKFKIVAKKLGKSKRVVAKIRQSKR